MGRVMFGGGKVGMSLSGLPKGYTKLTYIQSSGTQYINTGWSPSSQNVKVLIEYEYTASPYAKVLFGTENLSNGRFAILYHHDSETALSAYVGGSRQAITHTVAQNIRYSLSCHANNGSITSVINGDTKTGTYSGNMEQGLNFFLLTNGSEATKRQLSAKLYSCQIYDNGVLVRDFVPCLSDASGVGLFDIVEKKFYDNAGTGNFIGSEVA